MSLIKSISGIRGTIGGRPGDGLSPVDVVKFTSAFATFLLRSKNDGRLKMVVGRDARLSGDMVDRLVVASLVGMGVDVVETGLSTTPTTEMAVINHKADGGVIITASHNPMQWNALKMLNSRGEFIDAAEGAEVIVQEKLYTHADQTAVSEMDIALNGEGAKARVISRSVAADDSNQTFYPRVEGNAACFGHVQCDTIIMGNAKAKSIPAIACNDVNASLVHEAAIGRIAGDQILKLLTLGLTEEEAEEQILEGFLR